MDAAAAPPPDASSSDSSTTQRGRAGYAYTAIGTLSSAFSGLWYRSGGDETIKGERNGGGERETKGAGVAAAAPPSSYSIPGGWGTGYFARAKGKSAHLAANAQPPRDEDGDDEGADGLGESPSPPWQKRSVSGARKRGALPFDLPPGHSRTTSIDSKGEMESQSSCSSPRPPPSQVLPPTNERSAMATLTRLKAQSSRASLRSTFDAGSLYSSRYDVPSSSSASTSASSWFFPYAQGAQDDDASVSAFGHPSSSSPPPSAAAASIRPGAPAPKDWREALARTELLDSYVQSIVYQSGIDDEHRPIVILTTAALPDPKEVDYDALLGRIMDQMELFVQNDYTVVFFAGGAKYRPPWTWIWSAYRRLSRPFRKNIRRLYICHPTFFTRSLVQVVSTGSAVLSPKFARKITQVNTLSEMARHVDLAQMDIPPHVYEWNFKYEKEVVVPEKPRAAASAPATTCVFGARLSTLMGERGERGGLPRVVRDCVEELLRDGGCALDAEGLFRKSPSSSLLRLVQAAYDRGQPVSLAKYDDPHMPAALLKLFFRSMPEPIFPASTYNIVRTQCPPVGGEEGDEEDVLAWIRDALLPLIEPPSKLLLFSYVVELLHKASLRCATSKMDATNLATVWAPNFVRSNDAIKDMAMCRVAPASSGDGAGQPTLGTLIKICIERYYEIFEFDYQDYEPPVTGDLFFDSSSLPSSDIAKRASGDATSLTLQSPRRPMGGSWSAADPSTLGRKGGTPLLHSPASFTSTHRRRSSANKAAPSAWAGHSHRLSAQSAASAGGATSQQQQPQRTLRSPASSSSLLASPSPTTATSSSPAYRRGSVPASPASTTNSRTMRSPSTSLHSNNGAGGGLGLAFTAGSASRHQAAAGLGNPLSVGSGRSASGSLRLISSRAKLRGAAAAGGNGRLVSAAAAVAPISAGGASAGGGGGEMGSPVSPGTQLAGQPTSATSPANMLFATPSGAALTGAEALGAFFVNDEENDAVRTATGSGPRDDEEDQEELVDDEDADADGDADGDVDVDADQTFISTAETLSPPRGRGQSRSPSPSPVASPSSSNAT